MIPVLPSESFYSIEALVGLYIHIPFCKQACHYCDFHFSVSQKNKKEIISAMLSELKGRSQEANGQELSSVYLGGGTPSVLSEDELHQIIDSLRGSYKISEDSEICIETNPDDIKEDTLESYKRLGINRLSLGVQSFRDEDLTLMNRAHNAAMSKRAIELIKDAKFKTYTVDLIYGIPGLSDEAWLDNLDLMKKYDVPHFSAYSLTIEDKTAFGNWVKKGKMKVMDDAIYNNQFLILMNWARDNSYDHYEISNFCKPGHMAKHNTNYWRGVPYIGVGPSAHSFNGNIRRWNVASNSKYLSLSASNSDFYETETLTENDMFNEYLMTGLRTKWGIEKERLENSFNNFYTEEFRSNTAQFISEGLLRDKGDRYILTENGKLVADKITSDLFAL